MDWITGLPTSAPATLRIHMPVNVKSVKPYFARPAELGPVDEVPQLLHSQGRELWEVEEILAERVQKLKRQEGITSGFSQTTVCVACYRGT